MWLDARGGWDETGVRRGASCGAEKLRCLEASASVSFLVMRRGAYGSSVFTYTDCITVLTSRLVVYCRCIADEWDWTLRTTGRRD